MRFKVIVPDLTAFFVQVDTVAVQFCRQEAFFIDNTFVAVQIIGLGVFGDSLKEIIV